MNTEKMPVDQMAECVRLLNEVRGVREGASVTFFGPDPNEPSTTEETVHVVADWTFWQVREFTGPTLLDALLAAAASCERGKNWPWVRLADRKPPVDEVVLVSSSTRSPSSYRGVAEAKWTGDRWDHDNWDGPVPASFYDHWQPMPDGVPVATDAGAA